MNFDKEIERIQTMRNKVSNISIDPYDFIFNYCYTIDQGATAQGTSIKKFPDKEYLRHCIKGFLEEDLYLIVKSRQMTISWLFCALMLWWTLTHPGSAVFMVSEKEEKAGFAMQSSLLSRVKFMYDHLPEHLKPEGGVKITKKPPTFTFLGMDSAIYGVSQDSDALRGYTASIVFWDELAFMDHAEEAYSAVKPTLMSGGKLCGVSTLNGKQNLFYHLAYDIRVEAGRVKSNMVGSDKTYSIKQIESRNTVPLMRGMHKRTNANDYSTIFLHYKADPEKTQEWADSQKKSWSNPEQWEQEMELSPISTSGLRVYPEFKPSVNIKKLHRDVGDRRIFNYDARRPIWRGWDFGYHHPAVIFGQLNHSGQFQVLGEYIGNDITIDKFGKEVIEVSEKHFPGVKFMDAGDPACRQVNDKSEKTSAEILRGLGIRIQSKKIRTKDGLNLIRSLYREKEDGFVGLVLDEGAELTIEGNLGGYIRNDKDEPVKDNYYDHIQDALRYLLTIIYDVKTCKPVIPGKVYTPKRPTASDITGY